jgi:putative phosphoesterase
VTGVARLGLISDTHGLLRPEVFSAFRDVDRILHAGDVEDPRILTDLSTIAPVTAVWGNVDGVAVQAVTREETVVEAGGVRVALIHGHQVHPHYAALSGRFPGARVIVHGHTHVPRQRESAGVLLVNPGAAGDAQKGYPPSVAILEIRDGAISARHVELCEGGASS